MQMSRRSVYARFHFGAVCLTLLVSCGPSVELPANQVELYSQLQRSIQTFPFHGGQWEQHFGDAPYYGTAFHVRADRASGQPAGPLPPPPARPGYRAIAVAAMHHNVGTLHHAADDRGFFIENLEEVMMSTLGLIEYIAVTGDRSPQPVVEETIDTINTLTTGLRNYVDIDAGKFAIKTYGPTAITAGVALLNLQYATYITPVDSPAAGITAEDGTARTADRIAYAQKVVEAINQRAWDGSRYLISPDNLLLEIYPNTMMMLVLCRLYERTGERQYLDRAEAVFQAIQPLRSSRGGYNSPYSKEEMGATTDDYSTLSSQNYLSLALATLYQDTADRRYLDEALFVLEFIRSHLYDAGTGHLLHHWIDGRIALPTDPEYFCTGCNLQFLYVMWYMEQILAGHAA